MKEQDLNKTIEEENLDVNSSDDVEERIRITRELKRRAYLKPSPKKLNRKEEWEKLNEEDAKFKA